MPDLEYLKSGYLYAKEMVIRRGYSSEILQQSTASFEDLNESAFLRELAWVILSSGMRESVIRKVFRNVSRCFYDWASSSLIINNRTECFNNAIYFFNNKSKISAIICAANILNGNDFNNFKITICKDPITSLQQFPYIGQITVYHLAKNIGLPFAKPDRHLTRITEILGFEDVQEFCRIISEITGDSIPVVDIVLWRFATIDKNYLEFFKKI